MANDNDWSTLFGEPSDYKFQGSSSKQKTGEETTAALKSNDPMTQAQVAQLQKLFAAQKENGVDVNTEKLSNGKSNVSINFPNKKSLDAGKKLITSNLSQLSEKSPEKLRKEEAKKNPCIQCQKEGKTASQCSHKDAAKSAGSSGGSAETEAAGSAEKDEPKKSTGISGSEQRHDKPDFGDVISIKYNKDTVTLTPKDPSKGPAFGNKLKDAWEEFRKQHGLDDKQYDIRETFDAKGNKTIAFNVPNEHLNKFTQSLADKGIINQNSAKQLQQQHNEHLANLAKPQNAAYKFATPADRLKNPYKPPRLEPK
ncbi:MAG TPA: hypothetical protein VGV92_08105 [Gammaproteobacteria bacterium]|nr:hypothetical protein [Gammaproteobacteria bacterium]